MFRNSFRRRCCWVETHEVLQRLVKIVLLAGVANTFKFGGQL